MIKSTTIDTEINELVQLIDDSEVEKEMGTAFSSVMLNPAVTWAKFILTDDKPNANRQRIPHEEFANLIRSGQFMPIKMALNEIRDGHDKAIPLGVMTHLKEDGDKIVALAALWSKERPQDVELLKKRYNDGSPINISWEIQFSNSVLEEGGVEALQGTELSAATVVGMPAYAGRTPMIAFAAKKWSQPYIESLPDASFLYVEENKEKDSSGKTVPQFRHFPILDADGQLDITRIFSVAEEIGGSKLPKKVLDAVASKINTLKEMQEAGASLEELNKKLGVEPIVKEIKSTMDEKEILELKTRLAQAEATVDELTAKLETATAALAEKESALASKETALAELQSYKDEIEGEKTKTAKLLAIKEKFAKAGLEKPEEYFAENADYLLKLEDESLDFMVKEMAVFATGTSTSEASTQIPDLHSTADKPATKDLVAALRELNKK